VRRNACVLHNPVPSPVPPAQAQAHRRLRLQRLRRWAAQGPSGDGEALTLLLASRLVPGKGILEFLHAALDLLARGGLRLRIAGAGPLEPMVQAFVAAHGVARQVDVMGFVEDIDSAYGLADVVVLSSSSEGFGRVGFEAYQAGCLVLGTQHNSFGHEIVAHSPAWHVAAGLVPLAPALQSLASAEIPDDGSDIAAMQAALQVAAHADCFLSTIAPTLHHA
jgi:glycosyltransferase involved in cell wall biosynthesis